MTSHSSPRGPFANRMQDFLRATSSNDDNSKQLQTNPPWDVATVLRAMASASFFQRPSEDEAVTNKTWKSVREARNNAEGLRAAFLDRITCNLIFQLVFASRGHDANMYALSEQPQRALSITSDVPGAWIARTTAFRADLIARRMGTPTTSSPERDWTL